MKGLCWLQNHLVRLAPAVRGQDINKARHQQGISVLAIQTVGFRWTFTGNSSTSIHQCIHRTVAIAELLCY